MVKYAHLGAKACDTLFEVMDNKGRTSENWKDSFGYFQYQLDQWQLNIPDELQFVYEDTIPSKSLRFLRTILYLRANHLRILIARPFLYPQDKDRVPDEKLYTAAVGVASDTIHILSHLNSTSEIYRLQQAQFNYFLMNALGVVLLAIAREPLVQRSTMSPGMSKQQVSQSAFDMARNGAIVGLNLLRSLAEASPISRRLWARVSWLGSRLDLLGVLTSSPTDAERGKPEENEGLTSPKPQETYASQFMNELGVDTLASHFEFTQSPSGINLDLNFGSLIPATDYDLLLNPSFITPGF